MGSMTSFIAHTTVDCANAFAHAEWWKQVLGYVEVPDEKRGKNRIHFDIEPHTGTRDDEVRRVVALGATEVADQRDHYGPGIGWVVLQDPWGNEFCILRSEEERAANPMQPRS